MITMDDEERFKELIEQAVTEAIAPFAKPHKPVLISRVAVAKRLNVSATTLWRWANDGYLPVVARLGRQVFYSENSIRSLETGQSCEWMKT